MTQSDTEFHGVIGRTAAGVDAVVAAVCRTAPAGAPNVVMVLLDDVGYAQFGCYGSDIRTPTFDRLAAGGLRYSNFHTTALCSPTRACLLTGRNHHSNGMARIVEFASGFPGYDATIPKSQRLPLGDAPGATATPRSPSASGTSTPAAEMAMGGRRDRWPLGRGFERFYGFLAGETDQFHPDLVYDNHQIDPPRHTGAGLPPHRGPRRPRHRCSSRTCGPCRPTSRSSSTSRRERATRRTRRRLSYIDRYRGQFDLGWDRVARSGVRPAAGVGAASRPGRR